MRRCVKLEVPVAGQIHGFADKRFVRTKGAAVFWGQPSASALGLNQCPAVPTFKGDGGFALVSMFSG